MYSLKYQTSEEDDYVEINKNGEEEVKVKNIAKIAERNGALPVVLARPVNEMEWKKVAPITKSYYGTYENDYSKILKTERGLIYYAKKFCCCI